MDIRIKNPNYCSVFRSELIAIRRGLQFACETKVQFQDVRILTDSCTSVQHLYNWTNIGSRLGGVVGLSLAFCIQGCGFDPRPKSEDFPNTENRQRPCGMIIRHEKDPPSVRLDWMFPAKLNS
ncbi:hypothetical protein TNCV_4779991 [Trichonephila clavipes]|nr:hypothetical protein TNCV_4779991 [Trichonephila clavipes]